MKKFALLVLSFALFVNGASADNVGVIWRNDTTAKTISFNDTFGHQISVGGYNAVTGVWNPSGEAGSFTSVNVGSATFVSVRAVNLVGNTTAPTISSGFGTSPSVTAHNGTWAFRINVGTGGTANSGVIGLPTVANGWNCSAADITTQSATVFLTKQTASSTTTATVGNFDAAGAAAAWAASDILAVECAAL